MTLLGQPVPYDETLVSRSLTRHLPLYDAGALHAVGHVEAIQELQAPLIGPPPLRPSVTIVRGAQGRLVIDGAAYQKEIDYAKELVRKGHNVVLRGKRAEGGDLIVDGDLWELKTLQSPSINAVRNNIKGAKKQSPIVVIDGRSAGLSYEVARQAVTASAAAGRMGEIKKLVVHTVNGDYIWVP